MGAMSKNADGANGTTERPGDLSEQSDNPQLWSPWKFWKKGRDWHLSLAGYDREVISLWLLMHGHRHAPVGVIAKIMG
jgi:hypothetical protein